MIAEKPSSSRRRSDPPVRRVLVVDDHRAIAEAVALALNMESDLECIGTPGTAREALEIVEEKAPDVILMDFRLPDLDGISATERVKQIRPETQVLIFTGHTQLDLMWRAAAAGASGFLSKGSSMDEVLRTIRRASEGDMIVQASVLATILKRSKQPAAPPAGGSGNPLTPREQDVLGLLSEGLDPQRIASHLGMSLHTARGHVKNILMKLGVHSQLEAVVAASRRGLLPTTSA